METLVAAIIGAVGVVIAGWLQGRRVGRKVAAVHDEVRTNHGLRAGEYLEQIPALARVLADHTVQDSRNFDEIRLRLNTIEAKVS